MLSKAAERTKSSSPPVGIMRSEGSQVSSLYCIHQTWARAVCILKALGKCESNRR